MGGRPADMSDVVERVRAALGKVKDPATGNPIVAAGQLHDVTATDDRVAITVNVISPGYPLGDALDASIRAALEGLDVPRVEIEHRVAVPQKPARQDLNRLPTVKNVVGDRCGQRCGVGKSTVAVNVA